jgi:two-component system, OmpR family, copper resistance phosphate regulon response regulator CusR
MKILIIEDQPTTGAYLKRGLVQAGFAVDVATDGRDGLHLAVNERYDLVVLDVMLPGMGGWEGMRGIRQAGSQVPVLFLTARDQVDDRIKGLELGADDYLVKPFVFAELLARIRARLRRGQSVQALDRLSVADLDVDLVRRRVTRAGRRIEVTAKEFSPVRRSNNSSSENSFAVTAHRGHGKGVLAAGIVATANRRGASAPADRLRSVGHEFR